MIPASATSPGNMSKIAIRYLTYPGQNKPLPEPLSLDDQNGGG